MAETRPRRRRHRIDININIDIDIHIGKDFEIAIDMGTNLKKNDSLSL